MQETAKQLGLESSLRSRAGQRRPRLETGTRGRKLDLSLGAKNVAEKGLDLSTWNQMKGFRNGSCPKQDGHARLRDRGLDRKFAKRSHR